MKNIALCLSMTFLLVAGASAQIVPTKIQKYLNDNYNSSDLGQWKQAAGACGAGKWLLTGDFNGDGRTDYLARILTGRGRQQSLHLIGFINEKGDYTPDAFFEEEYTGDLTRSATSVLKRGTIVSSSLGSEAALKTDVVNQYICDTDGASTMYAFNDGEFKNVQDPVSLLDKPSKLPGPVTPTPTPTPSRTPVPTPIRTPVPTPNSDIPNIEGTYTIYDASGNVDKNTGTVFYKDGTLTFKMSDGHAFSSATAFSQNGLITTGWQRTATVSSDGRTIFWSNKTKWVRK
jgi:hypothetical protein